MSTSKKTATPKKATSKTRATSRTAPASKTPRRQQATVKAPTKAAPPPALTKQAALNLLSVPSGATIQQLIDLTGWQAHTVRGTISGVLRKRLGLEVTSSTPKPGAPRIYRIASGVQA